jgi:ABC-type transport system involved in multi-copper enzyme maturation permease subunit
VRSTLIITRFTLHEAVSRRLVLAGLVLSLVFLGLFGSGFSFVYDRQQDASPRSLGPFIVAALLTLMGLYVVNFLAGFLALFLSVGAVSGEIDAGTLHALLARPIHRAEFIVGRWLAYVILIGAYISLMASVMMLFARVTAGYEVPDPLRAIGLMVLSAVALLTLSLFGSALISTLANGVVVFTLFGLAWLAGVIELIGTILQNHGMLNLGIVVSLLVPSDAIWRGASYYLQPASMLAMAGRETMSVPLPLAFASTAPPPPTFLLWALLYPLVLLAATIWTFARRDL